MKNKKIIIISIIAIVVVVAITIGLLYFTTDLFKTNQQLFYKYLTQTKVIDPNFIKQYNIANDKITKNSNSSSGSMDFSISIPNQETGIADIQKLFSVKSNGLKNTLLKQSYRDFTFSNNNQNFLILKYIKDNNTYGIFADNILSKYLAIENKNLKEFFSKLGMADMTSMPDSIPTNYDEILKIDEVTLEQLKQTYGTLIYDNIDETNFEKSKNEDKTETLTLFLSQQNVNNVLKIILTTMKNDNAALNLILEKAKLLQYNQLTIENIQTGIQKLIDEIGEISEYSSERNFIVLSLIKKDENIIKINIETNYKEVNTSIVNEDNVENTDATKLLQEEIKKVLVEINLLETNKINILIKEDEKEIGGLAINYFYNNNDIKLNVELNSKVEENIGTSKIQYEISNYQSDNIVENFIANIYISEEENYQININNNTILKQDVQISKLTTENSAKVNDLTSEELNQLGTALINRIMVVYGSELNNLLITNMNSEINGNVF